MASANKPKKVCSGKSYEKDQKQFEEDMEDRIKKLEKITNNFEYNLKRLVDHINGEPSRLIIPPNPPAYVS